MRRSVSAAAGRSGAGTSGHAASSSSSSVRSPDSSASTSRRSRSRRCAMYSSSLAAGSQTYGPCPGTAPRGPANAGGERVQIRGQRALARGDEDAPLPQHRVAREATRPHQEAHAVGRVPGRPDSGEGANRLTVGRQRHVHIEQPGRLGVIGMRMGKNHPLNAVVRRAAHRVDMRPKRRPRINDPPVYDVGVRPVQGERRRVVGAHADDPLRIRHAGVSTGVSSPKLGSHSLKGDPGWEASPSRSRSRPWPWWSSSTCRSTPSRCSSSCC